MQTKTRIVAVRRLESAFAIAKRDARERRGRAQVSSGALIGRIREDEDFAGIRSSVGSVLDGCAVVYPERWVLIRSARKDITARRECDGRASTAGGKTAVEDPLIAGGECRARATSKAVVSVVEPNLAARRGTLSGRNTTRRIIVSSRQDIRIVRRARASRSRWVVRAEEAPVGVGIDNSIRIDRAARQRRLIGILHKRSRILELQAVGMSVGPVLSPITLTVIDAILKTDSVVPKPGVRRIGDAISASRNSGKPGSAALRGIQIRRDIYSARRLNAPPSG